MFVVTTADDEVLGTMPTINHVIRLIRTKFRDGKGRRPLAKLYGEGPVFLIECKSTTFWIERRARKRTKSQAR